MGHQLQNHGSHLQWLQSTCIDQLSTETGWRCSDIIKALKHLFYFFYMDQRHYASAIAMHTLSRRPHGALAERNNNSTMILQYALNGKRHRKT